MKTLQNLVPGVGTAAQNRAYDVLLNFITISFPKFAGIPTETEWVHSGYGDSNHKIRVQVYDFNSDERHYEMALDFNTRIFNEVDREQAVEHFTRVLDACLTNPDQPAVSNFHCFLTMSGKPVFMISMPPNRHILATKR